MSDTLEHFEMFNFQTMGPVSSAVDSMESSGIGTQSTEKVNYGFNVVLASFKLKRLPFSVKFHPSNDKQNIFLVGSSNKKIMQFDLNTGRK